MIGSGTSAGKPALRVEHVQVIAHYDPASGAVRHIHTVTTLGGNTPLSQEEAITEAKRFAGRHIPEIESLKVALSNDPEHGYRPHRIDAHSKAFVPLTSGRGART